MGRDPSPSFGWTYPEEHKFKKGNVESKGVDNTEGYFIPPIRAYC